MIPAKPREPDCADCGKTLGPTVARIWKPSVPDGSVGEWLCGDCEYLREHPDAQRAVKARSQRAQRERLFDL